MEKTNRTQFISKDLAKEIFNNAPAGVNHESLLNEMVNRGYVFEGYNDVKPEKTENTLANQLLQRGENMLSIAKNTKINPLSRGLQGTGQIAGAVGDVIGAGVGAVAKGVDTLTGGVISDAGKQILSTELGQAAVKAIQGGEESYSQFKQANPEFSGNLEAIVNIGSLVPIGGAVNAAGKTAIETGDVALKGAKTLASKTFSSTDNLLKRIAPEVSAVRAVGQIAQGTTEDIRPLAQTLAKIDTTKVKTFQDLLGEVDKAIPTLAKQVDNELLKDGGVYSLQDLALTQTTKAGREIKTDYVSKALQNLSELYKTTGDDIAKADIEEIIAKANSQGLTRKEVNDISRIYGQEFSRKAFSKLGDPLTSVNAQAFENVRTGLKQVAREGIGGAEAKLLDEQLSAIYDTQRLIERNVEAVNKIKQKIQDRGLLEKLGNATAKIIDTFSGGTIRGFVGGLLPRGAGYKVMNALDIEEALRKNLDVFEKALKTRTDEDFLKILNSNYSKELKSRSASSLTNPSTPTTKNTKNNVNNMVQSISQTKKGASDNVDMYDVGGATMGAVQTDEEGNVTVNPAGAVMGAVGMKASKSLAKFVSPNMAKNIAKKMDETDLEILNNFRDGYTSKKLTDEVETATLKLLKDMGIDAYGLPPKQTKEVVDKLLAEVSKRLNK